MRAAAKSAPRCKATSQSAGRRSLLVISARPGEISRIQTTCEPTGLNKVPRMNTRLGEFSGGGAARAAALAIADRSLANGRDSAGPQVRIECTNLVSRKLSAAVQSGAVKRWLLASPAALSRL